MIIKLLYKFFRMLRYPYQNPKNIYSLRLFKLKRLLNHSKTNVSFYRSRYAAIELNRIKNLSDIRLLPIIKPIELRSQFIQEITAKNIKREALIAQTTSGTSGMPFKFYNTNIENSLRQLQLCRYLYLYGWKPWWKVVEIWRVKSYSNTFLQKIINKKKVKISINLPLQDQAQLILDIRPQLIFGMKDSLEILADWMLNQSIDYKKAKIVLTTGAVLDRNTSDKLQDVFGHPGLDMYSFVEGGFIGGKCPHCSLKYFEDDACIVEILNDKKKPISKGEKGRAVITVLDQLSTPIIRYDIGDFITTLEGKTRCKNLFTHYLSIDGREADKLNLSNGMTLHYQHLVPVRDIQGIKQFQLIKRKNGELIFKYVPKSDSLGEIIEKLVPEKVSLLRHAKISFEKCDFIPLEPSGKFKMVKEEL